MSTKRKAHHDKNTFAIPEPPIPLQSQQSQHNIENLPNAFVEKRSKMDPRRSSITDMADDNLLSQLESTQAFGSTNDKKVLKKQSGTIERVYLKNFKCHSWLEFNLHPAINFILGRNGSGKSAVMDAIILCLGGRAAITGRQASVKTFIKTGCDRAELSVTIKNEGDEAYQPRNYGSKITIERKISKDGTSGYRLLDENNKLVTTKKSELDNIIEQFNIQVENPVCFLNQETSKHFLNSSNKSDKYKLFLKASQLESMRILQENIEHVRTSSENLIADKSSQLDKLKEDLDVWKEKYNKCQSVERLRKRSTYLYQEFSWSLVIKVEKELEVLMREKEKHRKSHEKHDKKIEEKKEQLASSKLEYDKCKKEISDFTKQASEATQKHELVETEFKKASQNYKSVQNELRKIQAQIDRKTKERDDLLAQFNKEKSNTETDYRQEKERKEAKIESIGNKIKELIASERQKTEEIRELGELVENMQKTLRDKKFNMRNVERLVESSMQKINNLKNSVKDQIYKFGDFMPDLVAEVKRCYQTGKFKEMPRGPIGLFMQPKKYEWALAIEKCIGGLLSSFICGNYADEKLLHTIFAKYIREVHKRPRIIVMDFNQQLYDVEKYRPPHRQFSTVYEMLDIKDTVVANCLIDQRKIESVLLLPTMKDGIEIIEKNSTQLCNEAFLMTGDQLLGRPSFRLYASKQESPVYFIKSTQDAINEIQKEINSNRQSLNVMSKEIEDLEAKLNENTRLKKQSDNQMELISREKFNLNNQMKEAQNIKIPEPPDVAIFEQEIETFKQEISELDIKKSEIESSTGDLKRTYEQALAERDLLANSMQIQQQNTDKLVEAFKNAEAHKTEYEEAITYYKGLLSNIVAKEREIEEACERKRDEHKRFMGEMQEKDRIKTARTSDSIEAEIKQVERQIKESQRLNGNEEEIAKVYLDKHNKYKRIVSEIERQSNFLRKLKRGLVLREGALKNFTEVKSLLCSCEFSKYLSARNFTGNLAFNHEEQTLDIIIKTSQSVGDVRDLRALSGGERSFSTVGFLLSLWAIVESPLLFLDEFDVFMDQINRKFAMDLIVSHAKDQLSGQYVFLTPQDLDVEVDELVKLFKMPDPKRSIDQENNRA